MKWKWVSFSSFPQSPNHIANIEAQTLFNIFGPLMSATKFVGGEAETRGADNNMLTFRHNINCFGEILTSGKWNCERLEIISFFGS